MTKMDFENGKTIHIASRLPTKYSIKISQRNSSLVTKICRANTKI